MGVSHLETAAGDDSPPYLVDQDPEVPGSENTTKGWCFQALPRNVWTCESNGIIIIIIMNNSNSNSNNLVMVIKKQ
jgi:hypothetical protein